MYAFILAVAYVGMVVKIGKGIFVQLVGVGVDAGVGFDC